MRKFRWRKLFISSRFWKPYFIPKLWSSERVFFGQSKFERICNHLNSINFEICFYLIQLLLPSSVARAHPSLPLPPLFRLATWHGYATTPIPAGRGGTHPHLSALTCRMAPPCRPVPNSVRRVKTGTTRRRAPHSFGFSSPALWAYPPLPSASCTHQWPSHHHSSPHFNPLSPPPLTPLHGELTPTHFSSSIRWSLTYPSPSSSYGSSPWMSPVTGARPTSMKSYAPPSEPPHRRWPPSGELHSARPYPTPPPHHTLLYFAQWCIVQNYKNTNTKVFIYIYLYMFIVWMFPCMFTLGAVEFA
jgi:hypothetical protein